LAGQTTVDPLKKQIVILAALATAFCVETASAQYGGGCTMYEHTNFHGRAISLRPDSSVSFRSGEFWDDRASSVRVSEGCTLVGHDRSRMRGDTIEIERRTRSLVNFDWNDMISSAQCECSGAAYDDDEDDDGYDDPSEDDYGDY
jgi:hypothetical protein